MSFCKEIHKKIIPAYNGYRRNAAQNALQSSLQNVRKGFSACVALDSYVNCDDLTEIKVTCVNPDGTNCDHGGMTPNWCVDVENSVGGEDFEACVTISSVSGVSTFINNWEDQGCNIASLTCDGMAWSSSGMCPAGCSAPTTPACTVPGDTGNVGQCTGGNFMAMTVTCTIADGSCTGA